ncbi:phosphatidylinositol-glycan biosynthesis class S protein [Nitzschia inconspicua]|uniref:Phosphatidylinositol-glycan biosynthesis class S protein n=1 Tax=Nitzschia inconspicua TaxID=303405 RepID=A0A9K3KHJ8_9STRA|nr:phosphatidylinositol-glycan biosynthesis class S protein [Nitzschia inconspicua]
MAGTRLLLQGMILVEMFCIVLIAIHVGFCQPGLRRTKGKGSSLPRLFLSDDYLQTDPVLCPWYYFPTVGGDELSEPTTVVTASSESALPRLKLEYIVLLEDIAELSQWSAIVEEEWTIPSYVRDLESIKIDRPWQVYAVPPMDTDGLTSMNGTSSGHINAESIPTLWNHISSSNNVFIELKEQGVSQLILYIPKGLGGRTKLEEFETATPTPENHIPAVVSYHIQISTTDAATINNGPTIVIPTTKDTKGLIGSYIEEWTVQSVVGSTSSPSSSLHDSTTAFWNHVQAQWKQQTLQLYQHISTIPSAKSGLTELAVSSEDPSMTDLQGLQASIAQWMGRYQSLQLLLLFHTGSKKIVSPTSIPPPLLQDFPLEHYAAILMPLLFPLLVPFLLATVKEYKRYKEKRASKKTREMGDKEKVS